MGTDPRLRGPITHLAHLSWVEGKVPWSIEDFDNNELGILFETREVFSPNGLEVSYAMSGGWNYMYPLTMKIINGATTREDAIRAVVEWGRKNLNHVEGQGPSRPTAGEVYDLKLAENGTSASLLAAMLKSIDISAKIDDIRMIEGGSRASLYLPAMNGLDDEWVPGNFPLNGIMKDPRVPIDELFINYSEGFVSPGVLNSLAGYIDFLNEKIDKYQLNIPPVPTLRN